MTHVEFTFDGDKQLTAAMERSIPETMIAVGGALWREANAIMADSVPLVPVKWGILRGSAIVLLPEVRDATVEVTMGYGGAAQAYSVIQHEREDYRHNVGQAHYLSEPFEQHAAGMAERLASDIAAFPLFTGLP